MSAAQWSTREGVRTDLTCEVAVIRPDVDGAKAFCEETLGFRQRSGASYRVMRLTLGSDCSIVIGRGITQVTRLITPDIEATRAEFVYRVMEMSEPYHFELQGKPQG
jgi:hypothetical protein